MTTTNKNNTQARDTQIIAGITKDLMNTPTLLLAASTYTPATLIALVQSRINAANAVATTRASWLAAVKAYDALDTHVTEVETGLKQYVMNAFGKASAQLADFGFSPSKVTTQTTEEKQLAVQKRAATRTARNTMGKKAKAKIKGTVTPPAAPAAATAPATQPAPTTSTVNQVVTQAPTVTPPANAAPAAPKS